MLNYQRVHLKGFLRFLTNSSRLSPTTPFFSAKTSHAFRAKPSTGGCDSKGSSTNLPNWKKETTIRHLKVGLVGVGLVNHVTEPLEYIYTYHNMCQMFIQWLMYVYVWSIYTYTNIYIQIYIQRLTPSTFQVTPEAVAAHCRAPGAAGAPRAGSNQRRGGAVQSWNTERLVNFFSIFLEV